MTRRQLNMGVTEEGIKAAKAGEFLRDMEAFVAKMSTLKKGQYRAVDLTIKFMKESDEKSGLTFLEGCARITHEYDVIPKLNGLTVLYPDYFYYTNTHGLDCLTVK